MKKNINIFGVRSGRVIKEDGTVINEADIAEEIAQKVDAVYEALVVKKDAGFQIAGSSMGNGDSIPVGIKGATPELSSAKHTEMFAEVKEYTRADGASQIELYVETGYVRIRTDGQPCTEDTGEPLGAGFGMAWCVPSISVYFADDATVTVVSR